MLSEQIAHEIMEPIYIPRLTRAPQKTEVIEFNQLIPGLETLTPVIGQLSITHHGNYLEVSAAAETIVTLTCHRCLQQYNYRLKINPTELIWLDEPAEEIESVVMDREITPEDLVETLPPQGHFEPQTWLYEQLCLELPQQQLCDQNCSGIQPSSTATESTVDRRWASLEALKGRFSGQNNN